MSDLDGFAYVRRGGALVPADAHAEELLSSVKDGREILVSVRKARSVRQHRMFFALLATVVANTDDFQTVEELLDAVKIATGHVERRMTIDGAVYLAPKSINFASMQQDDFRAFFDRAVFLLATRVLGCTPDELTGEVAPLQISRAA